MSAVTKIQAIRALKGDEAAAKEIVRAVVAAKGSKQKACDALGVGKSTLYRVITELSLWDELDRVCKERGFRWRAGRPRGPVPEEIRLSVRAGRHKANGKPRSKKKKG